ncbi:MAG: aldehyde dehydrogenase [Victivallales bacterium]|nr:aldehyde dehydrogenase [Victivallales bacterium]
MNQIYHDLLQRQQEYFHRGTTRSAAFRLERLNALHDAIRRREPMLMDALRRDLGKSAGEALLSEIGMVYEELKLFRRRLNRWMKPRRAAIAPANWPAAGSIYPEPYGSVLIFSAWNYPFNLALIPLIGAIAAGNCVILKPSELAPATAAAVASLIREVFVPEHVAVCEGGPETGEELLRERFDLVFFTGSSATGRRVYSRAAEQLTPVILELGGKSPCIVDEDAMVWLASRRICWGKFLNAGQTCVAPDYLLLHRDVKKRFLETMQNSLLRQFGPDPKTSPDYPRIINERHFDRLAALLDSGKAVIGGQTDREQKYIAPTVLDEVSPDSPVMTEEIFGPILPIIEFTHLEEALNFVNQREKPLALYYFSRSHQKQRQVIDATSSGGVCINETVVHLANPSLPFGGVGHSGIGSYHGEHSFRTFSHEKPVLFKPDLPDLPLRYPPYTKRKMRLLHWIFR